ncbi:MAG: hypothetical protein J7L99_02865, partial [Planctomycetes bacterium]|nr:hypothetical protein [Planctomycetota bacterium]
LKGIAQAVAIGRVCPELIERIEKKLDLADDLQFSAMVTVLDRLGLFYTPGRKGYQIDRFRQITFATAPKNPTGTDVKRIMLHGIILDGRDNQYVRRALQLAMQDNAADIRSQAGLLAAKLRDYASLMKLLRDSNPSVRASSAIVAGLAGLKDCEDTIAELLKNTQNKEEIPALTFALAELAPKKFSKKIIETIDRAYQSWRAKNDKDDLALLEKLLFSASLLKDSSTKAIITKVIRESLQEKRHIPTMAIIAAGKVRAAASKGIIKQIIENLIVKKTELTFADVITLTAAVRAGDELGLSADLFIRVMEQLWHPATTVAMIFSSEALARRSRFLTAEQRRKAMEILTKAVYRSDTPVASSAAAVAIFKIAPTEALEPLRTVCESKNCLAGDYVAWNLAQSASPEAWEVAKKFLAPDEYDSSVKSVGAMLIASLARKTNLASQVAEGIKNRLERSPYIEQSAPYLAGTYRCALLMLSQQRYRDMVIALSQSSAFPKFRAVWALITVGEPMGFDYVLGRANFNPDEMDTYLGRSLLYRIYSKAIPQLPEYDIQAPKVVRYWQCRLCRDYYLIHRAEIISRIGK